VSTELRDVVESDSERDAHGPRLRPIGRASRTISSAVCLAVAPVVLMAVLRLPLVNQLDYADAWFYSAYGWVPKHHFRTFDWNYFSVRFPPILAIGGFDHVFGPAAGYVVLRYLLAITAGAAVFAAVRRLSRASVALATVLLLYANPFFSRMLLWDYAGFMAVAGGVVGVGLWYWSDGKRPLWSLPAGVALSLAFFANALLATAVVVLLCVEGVAAFRMGRVAVRRFAGRVAVVTLAGVGVFAAGYLGYSVVLGSLSPDDLLRPTIKFLGENDKNAAPYRRPTGLWLFHEPRIWAPILLSLGLVVLLRGRMFSTDLAARVAQFCVAYTGFFWVYRFAVTSSVVETWWAYSFVVVATAPAVGVLVHEVASRHGSRSGLIAVVGATLAAAILVRDVGTSAERAYAYLSGHVLVFLALLGTGALATVLATASRRAVALTGLGVVLTVGVLLAYGPSILDGRGATGIFVRSGDLEWRGYGAGKHFIEIVRDHDRPDSRVYLWYRGTLGLTNVAWTDLPQYGQTLQPLGVDESMRKVPDLGKARLTDPHAAFVMVMSTRTQDVIEGRRALSASGYKTAVSERGTLADGGLQFVLLQIVARP
jgi:hypothetical protein